MAQNRSWRPLFTPKNEFLSGDSISLILKDDSPESPSHAACHHTESPKHNKLWNHWSVDNFFKSSDTEKVLIQEMAQ